MKQIFFETDARIEKALYLKATPSEAEHSLLEKILQDSSAVNADKQIFAVFELLREWKIPIDDFAFDTNACACKPSTTIGENSYYYITPSHGLLLRRAGHGSMELYLLAGKNLKKIVPHKLDIENKKLYTVMKYGIVDAASND